MPPSRHDIEFKTLDNTTLRGWFYPVNNTQPSTKKSPSIIISHGFACLKEWHLDTLAARFQQSGIASLVYDQRNFGSSISPNGVKHELNPEQQALDVHDAVTFILQQPCVDEERLAVFGYSYSAAHAVKAAAVDRRIKAVVALSSFISGDWLLSITVADRAATDRLVWADRVQRASDGGEEPGYFPIVPTEEDGVENAILPMPDAVEFFTRMRKTKSPAWENKVTIQSLGMLRGYNVYPFFEPLAPTPLLLIVDEWSVGVGLHQKAFELAGEPKEFETFPGGHFDGLEGEFEKVFAVSVDFLKRRLRF